MSTSYEVIVSIVKAFVYGVSILVTAVLIVAVVMKWVVKAIGAY